MRKQRHVVQKIVTTGWQKVDFDLLTQEQSKYGAKKKQTDDYVFRILMTAAEYGKQNTKLRFS